MARLIAGAVEGLPFLEPAKVAGAAHLGDSGVDEWAAALLQFPNGIIAEVSCSVSLAQDNVLSACSAPRGGSRSPTSGSPPATRAAPAGSR